MVPFIYPPRVPFLCEAYFVFERKGSVWNEVWSEIIVFVPYIFFKLCLFSKSESERFVIKGRERGCLEWGLSQDHKIIVSSSLSLIYFWLIYFHIYYHHIYNFMDMGWDGIWKWSRTRLHSSHLGFLVCIIKKPKEISFFSFIYMIYPGNFFSFSPSKGICIYFLQKNMVYIDLSK
jgi:hypothetical protein